MFSNKFMCLRLKLLELILNFYLLRLNFDLKFSIPNIFHVVLLFTKSCMLHISQYCPISLKT
jgi:hypothetical protein